VADADVGRRLAEARGELGLTQAEVAAKLGVARSTLAEMEIGQRKVTADELYRLAELLSRPLQYFFSPQKPASIFALRLKSEEIGEPARRALVHLDNRLADVAALERFSGVTIRPQVQQYRVNAWKTPDVAGRNIARLERARLQLGTSPVPNVREVLEQRAGLLAFGDYIASGDFSGAYASDGTRSALLVNVAHIRGRVNFTLPHEYAHAVAAKDALHIELRGYADDFEERFADAFAANFLMPLEAIEEALQRTDISPPEITADEALFLASQFGVSFDAMLGRLAHFGIVEQAYARGLRKAVKPLARSRELGLPDPRDEFDCLPQTYRRMAFQAFHKGSISRSRLAEFLDTDSDAAYNSYVAWAASLQVVSAVGGGKRGAAA
jgi:Zn-dependent peptidase ImmA (M78 family)/transcriptional regulator with XRE-family HTH domain